MRSTECTYSFCCIYCSRFRNYCLLDYDRDLSYVEQLIKYLTDVKDGRALDYQERCKSNFSYLKRLLIEKCEKR